jgi:MSHA biogenesis protein MshP
MKPTRLAQHGFAAIAAIFLVLVLAAFGAFMVSFSNTQHLNTARDVQGSRAYWAARAGLEWGVAGVFATSACAAPSTTMAIESIFRHHHLSGPALVYIEGAATVTIFQITAVASSGTCRRGGLCGAQRVGFGRALIRWRTC